MATNIQRTIEIIFSGTDKLTPEALKVKQSIDQFSIGANAAISTVNNLTNKILLLEASLVVLGGALATKAYGAAVAFESSMASLTKAMDGNSESAKAIIADIDSMALKYGESSNVLVQSTADFVNAGYSKEQALKLVEQALKTAIAGDISATEATDRLKASLAGFGVPAGQAAEAAGKISDIINRIADTSASGFNDLLDGFTRLSPLASAAGLSMEETAAILSVVNDVFQNAEMSATALGSGLQRLADPSREVKETLSALGISTTDAMGKIRPAKDILADVAGAFTSLDDATKLQTASIIFGKEQAAKMILVLENWETVQNRVTDALKNSGGTVDKEVVIRLQTAEQTIKRTNEAWNQFLRVLGQQTSIETTGIIKGLGDIGLALKKIIAEGGLDPLLDKIRPQLQAFGELLSQVAKNLPEAWKGIDWSGLIASFENLSSEASKLFKDVFGNIDLSSVEGLTTALQKVVDIGSLMLNWTAGFVNQITPMLKLFADLGNSALWAGADLQELAGKLSGIAKVFDALGIVGIIAGISSAIANLSVVVRGTSIVAGLSAMSGALGAAGLAGAAGAGGYAIGTVLNDAISALISKMTGSQNTLGGWIYDVTHAGEVSAQSAKGIGTLEQAFESLKPAIDDSATAPKDFEATISAIIASEKDFDKIVADVRAATEAKEGMADTNKDLLNTTQDLTAGNQKYVASLEGGIPTFTQVSKGMGDVGDAAKKQAEDLEKAKAASLDWALEMEKIASNERIKKIEAIVTLNVEELKAETEKVKAAFESIDNSVNSTGDLLSDLFGGLNNAKSQWDRSIIEGAIQDELKRRGQLFKDQHELIQQQIKMMAAKTERLASGDALIQVDGTGLKPHLESIMWEILRTIQVRANAEFQEFLLGIST